MDLHTHFLLPRPQAAGITSDSHPGCDLLSEDCPGSSCHLMATCPQIRCTCRVKLQTCDTDTGSMGALDLPFSGAACCSVLTAESSAAKLIAALSQQSFVCREAC